MIKLILYLVVFFFDGNWNLVLIFKFGIMYCVLVSFFVVVFLIEFFFFIVFLVVILKCEKIRLEVLVKGFLLG